ncbi:MAG: phosphoglycerate dehydrogenase [Deltaproteobacteria bacterium]|jgi:D-3-phosphoglycerate dehydrogenase|nr:phosphoglycerate dehydrogenase [Deltaproteobacteria bacterium]
MKVLVSDNLGEAGIKMFESEPGFEVDVNTGLEPDALKSIIGDYDALVIRSGTKVTEDLLESAKNLKVIGRAGIGLDNVDIPAATKRGTLVMNTPTGNVITTAEHTIAMMMALTRNIPWGTATLKDGKWEKKKLQGREIYHKVLGVIGFGKIGSIVADRARGLKMRVIVHDPFIPAETIEKAGFEAVSIEDLYARSDYITIHVPKLKDTVGLLDRKAFDQMKDGVMIINCARGGIVSEADLNESLKSGKVAGAALDVFESEPPGVCPLFEIDRVICTPHLGASTLEAQTNVAVMVAEQIIAYLRDGTVINAVNVPAVSGDLLEKLNPYLTLADRMGCLLAQLSQEAIKEVLIKYAGDFDELDLSPVTTAVLKGLMTPMIKDDVNFVNAQVLAKERGIKVRESKISESDEYINLIDVRAISDKDENLVAGTIFGRKNPRVVNINNFRLELEPIDRFILIHNHDKPGAIGSIGTLLGDNGINISRMRVGQEEGSDRTMIFLRTDTPIPEDVIEKMRDLPLIINVAAFEL